MAPMRWSFRTRKSTPSPYFTAVASSLTEKRKPPSPTTATTWRSGQASLAPRAAGPAEARGGGAHGVEERPGTQDGEMPLHPVIDPRLIVHHDRVGGQRLAQDRDQPLHVLRVARPARGAGCLAPAPIPV